MVSRCGGRVPGDHLKGLESRHAPSNTMFVGDVEADMGREVLTDEVRSWRRYVD